jgi:hypothetical protein
MLLNTFLLLVALLDEEELVATLRAKQATNEYLRACVGITNSPMKSPAAAARSLSNTSSPASRTSTNPATTNRGTNANNSLVIEVDPETGLTPQPAYLLRSAIRNDALSAEKLPEKRVLFVDEDVADDDETEATETTEDETAPSEEDPTPSDLSYYSTTNTASTSGQSVTTVPNKLLQEVINELAKLRQENTSLKSQLEWALRRTDAVSERLLELSPCK